MYIYTYAHLPSDLAAPLLGIFPKEIIKGVHTDVLHLKKKTLNTGGQVLNKFWGCTPQNMAKK